jgi:hypothetical protein
VLQAKAPLRPSTDHRHHRLHTHGPLPLLSLSPRLVLGLMLMLVLMGEKKGKERM